MNYKNIGLKKIFQGLFFTLFPFLFFGSGLVVVANNTLLELNASCIQGLDRICAYMGITGTEDEEHTVSQAGKVVKITNNGNQQLFIPSKTITELNSFLAVKENFNIEACEVGLLKTQDSTTFGNGMKGCEDAPTCPTPTLNAITANEASFNLNNATANVVTLSSSTNNSTWSNQTGSPITPRSITAIANSYYKVKTLCTNGVESNYSNTIQYTTAGGGSGSGAGSSCSGTYNYYPTIEVDWNGNSLAWDYGDIFDQNGNTIATGCEISGGMVSLPGKHLTQLGGSNSLNCNTTNGAHSVFTPSGTTYVYSPSYMNWRRMTVGGQYGEIYTSEFISGAYPWGTSTTPVSRSCAVFSTQSTCQAETGCTWND